MPERIQKVLARAGVGSRRAVEGWISAGRIQVNGQVAQLGDRIGADDRVLLDGKPVQMDWRAEPRFKLLAYYKPDGEICTRSDPEGRKNVFDQLPRLKQGRWVALGRLDINSQGLMLFTTDGELANQLLHPSAGIEREYAARVRGQLSQDSLRALIRGVSLEDGPARFTAIRDAGGEGSNHWYHVVITEGRQREVRRLFESQGLTVARLMRVRFGPIELPRGKRPGQFWDLSADEIAALQRAARGTRASAGH
ncbi:23S rRNA pseudouridine2605 synthase [Methylohalomonas lacus]|uniref:Pseudouridine synthase n=1 Tax=Methylohalomonas lacus TaxID=398773 RepID=A0AAE3HKH8_9GAMM|nr:pseudouridine synthase [Methylohalomonas lacus]MCS3902898.1 23S rRNA pseudouridine2605 synthase [Methylohalomonas lacus]